MTQEYSSSKSEKTSLFLEDGTFFIGYSVGTPAKFSVDVMLPTFAVGNPEALADQPYKGHILRLTCHIVSDYGVSCYDSNLDSGFSSSEYNGIHATDNAITGLYKVSYFWGFAKIWDRWTANSVTRNNGKEG